MDWFQKWDRVLDESIKPFYKWFVGGKTNIVFNAVDRHLSGWKRNKLAIIWEGEPGDLRTYSYHALNREVSKFANVLKGMGIRKGDIVTIYMPQIPELVISMLAVAKIGAAHSVVYGGFSYEALAGRIEDADSKVLITAYGGFRRGKVVDLKGIANEAMRRSPSIEVCISVRRTGHEVFMENDRDFWYHDLMSLPIALAKCETVVTDAEDMLFILYTSGTTGKPKVSGYRLGSAEIESALVSHAAVSEAAAIALAHDKKGNAIHTYVTLKAGFSPSKALEKELAEHVAREVGAIAKPESVTFTDILPKTRSGKIMRRVLKARAMGIDEGDLTTLEE